MRQDVGRHIAKKCMNSLYLRYSVIVFFNFFLSHSLQYIFFQLRIDSSRDILTDHEFLERCWYDHPYEDTVCSKIYFFNQIV